jgi:hypothetical protein
MSPIRSPHIAHAAATAGFTFTTTTAPVDAVVDPQPTTADLPPLYPNPPLSQPLDLVCQRRGSCCGESATL